MFNFKAQAKVKALRLALEQLFKSETNDQLLAERLDKLRKNPHFPGLTHFWGPELYRRNRAVFRPFILNNYSQWTSSALRRWKPVRWAEHAERLEDWLALARQTRDTVMVRRLLAWKFSKRNGWGLDQPAWNAELCKAHAAASSPSARAIVLDEFDEWFELDENTALQLYATDPRAASFILKHLPANFWGSTKRKSWPQLSEAARRNKDEKFMFTLYRRLIPQKTWQDDILRLADTIHDPELLDRELERHHPEGAGIDLGKGLLKLLEARGRDVMPYIRRRLPEVLGGWWRGNKWADSFIKLAKNKEWWDLWAAAIRASLHDKSFNKAVRELLDNKLLVESERLARLSALAGVSREWNWSGFGLARVHALNDDIAARLYERYPRLIHGPFKPHVRMTWWHGYPLLLAAARRAGDDDLIDLQASHYITLIHDYVRVTKRRAARLATVEELADYYAAIRKRDPAEFARRAANVLTRVPAYAIFGYQRLLKTNKLARLFFVRSFEEFLAVPEATRDLVEGSDIHVQMLAYRILAQDDERARELAVSNLDILLGTLLRPLHRKTRLPAFAALANAARFDRQAAGRVVDRARQALRLPDKRYPKEELVGLIGRVLYEHPELQTPAERPRIYGLELPEHSQSASSRLKEAAQ